MRKQFLVIVRFNELRRVSCDSPKIHSSVTFYLAYCDCVARNISSKSIFELTAPNDFELKTLVHIAACSLVPKSMGVDTCASRLAGAATHVEGVRSKII